MPALLFANIARLGLAATWRPPPLSLRLPWVDASGAGLALATLSTQKILFLWPAVGAVLGWMTLLEARDRRIPTLLGWLGGFALPTAAVGGWFAARNALVPLVDQNQLLNLRWQTRYPPLPPLHVILVENLPLVLLALAGILLVGRGGGRSAPASLRWPPVTAIAAVLRAAAVSPAAGPQPRAPDLHEYSARDAGLERAQRGDRARRAPGRVRARNAQGKPTAVHASEIARSNKLPSPRRSRADCSVAALAVAKSAVGGSI